MQHLNDKALAAFLAGPENTDTEILGHYNRPDLRPGMVHFGVGNFHRCHQAVYVEELCRQGNLDWGIVGVSLRSANIRDQLAPQDYLYTEVTLGDNTRFRIIGSLLGILVAPEDPAAVINEVATSNIKLVTTTITEKGYCLASGKLNTTHPDFRADLVSLHAPCTIYGYLAAAIILRHQQSGAALSILCCDNVKGGGALLETGVQLLLQAHSKDSLQWAKKHVSFASSMVDRVCPATDENLKQLVRSSLELDDAWPVSAEPFSQWVIEDKFAGPRPPFDQVGALFTEDISPFEQVKLRFLNAGHSIVSVLGYLDNQATVHEALAQPRILEFAQRVLYDTLLPLARIPSGLNGEDYISKVMQRFHNSALPYRVQQVNTDSSQKIQQRWFPSIDEALSRQVSTARLSFMIAAWVTYIEQALAAGDLNDPLRTEFSEILQSKPVEQSHADDQEAKTIHKILVVAGADQFQFLASAPFMAAVLNHYKTLKKTSISVALNQIVSEPV